MTDKEAETKLKALEVERSVLANKLLKVQIELAEANLAAFKAENRQ